MMARWMRRWRYGWVVLGAIAIVLLGPISHQLLSAVATAQPAVPTAPQPGRSPLPGLTIPTAQTGSAGAGRTPTNSAPSGVLVPGTSPSAMSGTMQPGTAPPSAVTPGAVQPGTAQPGTAPATPVPAFAPPTAQFPPAATALALPVEAKPYSDPSGRFQVGIRQGYRVSPLAGAVLVESLDGNLAYTVVAQAQPADAPIALVPSFANTEALGKIAATVFQRGEGFQPGAAQPESGGGVVINWAGTLTIGGKSQPTGGVILVRPTPKFILLSLVAATEAGADRVQGTVAAIAESLKPI